MRDLTKQCSLNAFDVTVAIDLREKINSIVKDVEKTAKYLRDYNLETLAPALKIGPVLGTIAYMYTVVMHDGTTEQGAFFDYAKSNQFEHLSADDWIKIVECEIREHANRAYKTKHNSPRVAYVFDVYMTDEMASNGEVYDAEDNPLDDHCAVCGEYLAAEDLSDTICNRCDGR
jgi:hypothetical protein